MRSMHRRFLLLALAAAQATAWADALPAGEPPQLLADAFMKLMENQGRWSYRENQALSGLPGRARGETEFQVDPSRAYAEQYQPIQVEGRSPSAGDLSDYRALGEKVARRRRREAEEPGARPGDRLRIRVNFHEVTPDLGRATVVSQDAGSVTYLVPLRTSAGGGTAYDTFQLTTRVSKARREFEHATILQRQSMRVALVVSVVDAEIDLDFAPVDPKYPSVITHIAQKATVGLMFLRRTVTFEMRRSGFRRVAPYDERFGVKVGPLRAIDF
jgi:hypothetical protein